MSVKTISLSGSLIRSGRWPAKLVHTLTTLLYVNSALQTIITWLVVSPVRGMQSRGVYRVPTYYKNTSGALNIICSFHQCSQKMSYSMLFTLNWINSLRKMLQKATVRQGKVHLMTAVTTETHYPKYVLSLTVGVTRGTPAKSLKAK